MFLSSRRALTHSNDREDIGYVITSVLKIRDEPNEALQDLAEDSALSFVVRELEWLCLQFLDLVDGRDDWGYNPGFVLALGELRGGFAVYLRQLVEAYGLNVRGQIAELLYPTSSS